MVGKFGVLTGGSVGTGAVSKSAPSHLTLIFPTPLNPPLLYPLDLPRLSTQPLYFLCIPFIIIFPYPNYLKGGIFMSRPRTYKTNLLSPDGKILYIKITNLHAFCEEFDLNSASMHQLITKSPYGWSYHGWKKYDPKSLEPFGTVLEEVTTWEPDPNRPRRSYGEEA